MGQKPPGPPACTCGNASLLSSATRLRRSVRGPPGTPGSWWEPTEHLLAVCRCTGVKVVCPPGGTENMGHSLDLRFGSWTYGRAALRYRRRGLARCNLG